RTSAGGRLESWARKTPGKTPTSSRTLQKKGRLNLRMAEIQQKPCTLQNWKHLRQMAWLMAPILPFPQGWIDSCPGVSMGRISIFGELFLRTHSCVGACVHA